MIGIFYGTRPEYIKLLPVASALKKRGIEFILFQVQQHTDLIEGCEWDRKIVVNSHSNNRLNDICISIMMDELKDITSVLVQGDTTTATAVALSAFNRRIPVRHVEAGLRTYDRDNPFPEEINRRIISSLATTHYCPTERDKQHLINEGFHSDDILVTGNTVIDNLLGRFPTKTNKILITMHRRENHANLHDWFREIENLAEKHRNYEFIFPMHPNPKVQQHRGIFKNVRVVDPVDYETMLELISSCHSIITDSGGIQEEAAFFGKPCFVCRKVTERPCDDQYLCVSPEKLRYFSNLIERGSMIYVPGRTNYPALFYGDGTAGDQIAEDIHQRIR